jgi:hypothetical protein
MIDIHTARGTLYLYVDEVEVISSLVRTDHTCLTMTLA